MHCEFCNTSLSAAEPANVALLQHVGEQQDCREQFGYMLDNLRSSWTRNMSGG